MRKRDLLLGIFLVCLLSANIAFIAYEQAELRRFQVEIEENVRMNDTNDWGAMIYMRIYRNGILLSEETHHNVITNAARSALRGHIGDSALAVWHHLAIGTGSGGGAGSTTLVTEYSRYLGTYATVGSYNFTISFTWTAGNFTGQTITEYGVFNDATVGTMLDYDDSFSRGPLLASDSLQVTVNFMVGS